MFRTNGWPNANMIHATQNCELANAYYLVCLFHASSISWMFNCLSCTLTPSDKVKRNLLKMRTASLWCHNDHVKKENKPILLHIWKKHCPITRWSSFSTTNHDAMVKWFLHPRVNMMERSSTTHSSLTPSLCFLAQVAPFSPLGTQNAIFSWRHGSVCFCIYKTLETLVIMERSNNFFFSKYKNVL